MEQMLQSFQESLGESTLEIKKLQDESFSMHIKLNNRKDSSKTLHEFLMRAVVHDKLIREINDLPVNDKYLSPILELDVHLQNLATINKKFPAYREIEPELSRLANMAVNKIRYVVVRNV
jgi:hypothetical protein